MKNMFDINCYHKYLDSDKRYANLLLIGADYVVDGNHKAYAKMKKTIKSAEKERNNYYNVLKAMGWI